MHPRDRFRPVWPPALADYDYTRFHTRSRWAWEFLRRNEAYVRNWLVERPDTPGIVPLASSTHLARLSRRFRTAEKWGLCFLADPGLNALDADVFWHPSSYRHVLTVIASRRQRPFENSWISLRELHCEKTILVAADGAEHLLLRDRRRVLQLFCVGDSIAIEPCAVGFLANDVPDVRPKTNLMVGFADLYRDRNPGQAATGWAQQSLSLRNALIAVDGSMNGASHREIAAMIFGTRAVAEDWSGGHGWMKSRIGRAINKGHGLVRGGYQDLIN